jgi:nitroimidazol reductase NimA-like FMN-containing flavoprotein (pyridoxamine 5'-phosphate oxidase superfamily)
MTDFSGVWTEDEVTAFLQETTIPIRIATRRSDGSLWPVTVWYRYRDGAFECATQATADLVGILRNDPTVGVDVSTNNVPYSGVRGTGTATISEGDGEDVLRDLVQRYLGGTDSSLAEWLLSDDREEVVIRIDPDEIYSWDYSDRMRDVDQS